MPLVAQREENSPILIFDKEGNLGFSLLERLDQESLIVFVSGKEKQLSGNVLFVPFEKKIPVIPDNKYSYIFVIDNKSTREILPSLFKKAREDKAVFTIVFHIKDANQNFLKDELLEYKETRIVFLGDIFGADLGPEWRGVVNRFLTQAKNRGRIEVPGDGTKITYPIFIDDAISGILEATFGTHGDRVYYLFPKYGITLISLAHVIQKTNPDISIDFTKDINLEEIKTDFDGKYLLPERYNLEEKIKNLQIKAKPYQKSEFYEEKKDERRFYTPNLKKFSLFLIIFLLLPLITTLFSFKLGSSFLESSRASLLNWNFQKAEQSLFYSKLFLSISNKSYKVLIFETQPLRLEVFNSLGKSINNGESEMLGLSDLFESINLLSEGNGSGILKMRNFLILAQKQKTLGDKIIADSFLNFASNTIDAWPSFFEKGKYLLLFQNSKLRPSGGEISSFTILNLQKGKIEDLTIHSVDFADKNLKGHVEPPFAIRRYLRSPHWFLKDGNFSADFVDSASSSAFFIDLEIKDKMDGVISVNTNFLKNLLQETGGVFVPEYKKVIDSKNLSQIMGDLSPLVESIKKKLRGKELVFALISSIGKSVEGKDIIFAFSNPSMQNVFKVNGYSSSLFDEREESQSVLNDFIAIVEANFGEAPNDVERKVTLGTSLDGNGSFSSTLFVNYENKSDFDYKNYLRIIFPFGSRITKIKIDGVEKDFVQAITDPSVYEAKDFKPPDKLELNRYDQNGKTIFGFLDNVSKNQKQNLEISYEFSKKLSQPSSFSYNLRVFKQPGVDRYPFSFSFSFPNSYTLTNVIKNITLGNGKIIVKKDVSSDFDLNFNFSQK